VSAGRKSRGGVSFRVIEGGGDPVARRRGSPLLCAVGTVVFGWAVLLGIVWLAYSGCQVVGVCR
jgi:hypothetical protein